MAREILMPKLGLTMVEGTIRKWFVNEGDHVEIGDKLFEVETDKLTNEIEADTEGVVRKLLVNEGQSAPVKALIGIIAEKNEDITGLLVDDLEEVKFQEENEKSEEPIQEAIRPKNDFDYILATPYAKKLAERRGINLKDIKAAGYEGVIVAKDVEGLRNEDFKIKVTPVARKMALEYGLDLSEINKDSRINKDDVLALYNSKIVAENVKLLESIEIEKATGMRKIIAQRMKTNWAGTPMVTFNMEVDMTELIQVRERLKQIYSKEGLKLTYNHLIMKILSKLLVKYKYLNASIDNDTITCHKYVNLGIAVDVEKGLVVPNVKEIDRKTLKEISQETEQLIEEARTGKLNPDNLAGGTFTITNIGMFGMDSFTPIINKPEVAILGINRIVDRPVIIDKQIVIRPIMNLCLTTDHSLVDGALSARFLSEIKQMIENPYMLID